MASANRVILMGNLTRDIELRYTPSGMSVANAGLAVNDKRKQGDQWVDDVMFVDLTFWGKTAEAASQYLSKGSPVYIEGRLKLDTWEKDGAKHSKHTVTCDKMQMLGSKSDGGQGGGTGQPSGYRVPSNPQAESHDDSTDIPF